MNSFLIETSSTAVELRPAPIEPSWVIEGNPVAKNAVISQSNDRTATTIVWECSEGKFNWYYDFDETICILEGSIVLESDGLAPKRYGPGDVVFFKKGAHARWHVEGHVRKIAFCRRALPAIVGLGLRAMAKLNRMLASPSAGTALDAA